MKIFFSAIGQDSHRFEPESTVKPLMLGGVHLPDAPGLAGNSDADVILHALCNALSGLSGSTVLGTRTDTLCNEQRIIDSRVYVREALSTLKGIEPVHVSISVEARRPHLSRHSDAIRQSIAGLLSLPIERVGLTATSGEGLTAFGSGEGIQAFVIVSACRSISEG
ncbi:MAG: 2-C-methyl-D-erythritol 2,4-cyclodiphosphate synthase [Chitinispirillaceae bacterium]|nr:2-C-methyl-D-erythritol 2,4-cyclodiphosphate synthase [Chitinispirillaceae bacterium]